MILKRLYELAQREGLSNDPAFVRCSVPCLIQVDSAGAYLGIIDVRERRETPGKRGGPPKVILTGGRSMIVPVRPVQWDRRQSLWKTTDPAASGDEKPACFLADTIARVLPVEQLIDTDAREKFRAQRSTFWRFLGHVANETNDPALRALTKFQEQFESSEFQERLANDINEKRFDVADLCSFAWQPDEGQPVLERPTVADWWRTFHAADAETQQSNLFRGVCQLTEEITAIGPSIKSKINGLIPVGGRAETYLVTGLTSAESYNLDGAVSGMVSQRGVDGFTRALNALIANELPGRPHTAERVGNALFLFWTREPMATGIDALFAANPEEVDSLLTSVHTGQQSSAAQDANQFYLLVLSGNSARVVVRDYLETPLPKRTNNLAQWFQDLRIADLSKSGAGLPTSRIPLWQLAVSTALEMEQVAPDITAQLVHAAIYGQPVATSILIACLRRLRAEGSDGFRLPRMALIKLILLRRNILVTETLNPDESHAAYLCGRLLAIFENIQYAALGGVNANVTDKYFGVFSTSPAMLLNRLMQNARQHLRRLRGEKPGLAVKLDQLLTEVANQLGPAPPRGKLSPFDQGRFALGYYHQRFRQFEEIAEQRNKAAEQHLAETTAN